MAVINEEEKSKKLSISGEQIEDAVSKIPTIEADIKTNASNITRVYTDVMMQRTSISELENNKANTEDVYTRGQVDSALSQKVDAEEGKGLSSNDYTTNEKEKLSGLENYNDIEIKTEIALNRDTLGFQRKNLLDVKSNSTTISGITYTVNPDRSITANGTATSNAIFEFSSNVVLPTEKLAFTGNPVGASDSTFRLYLMRSNFTGTTEAGTSNDVFFTPQANTSYLFRIVVYSGQTVDNLTFYPMLRKADITDSTYTPYQPSVADQFAEILSRIAALETASAVEV